MYMNRDPLEMFVLRKALSRTATYLMRHLSRLCSYTSLTDMTAKNLAIVWAPNLFRAPPTLDGGDSHLLNGLDVHTSLCSYLITNSTSIFVDDSGDPVIISGNWKWSFTEVTCTGVK
ncbi:hypothetical protein ANCDUO_22750 [Ancylostoma duodenale]|uniref:Rho-GAP domain-containing protein n=1 Tax=Ancylostoma duodenale TaxID=51022 RepID=A0A0C2CBG4_9BILA|nr:hypothetical protein ANCDUO_22750 [Ancylostoma duodenale]